MERETDGKDSLQVELRVKAVYSRIVAVGYLLEYQRMWRTVVCPSSMVSDYGVWLSEGCPAAAMRQLGS